MLFVNTNTSALRGMADLSDVTARMNKSFERLSSGSRINSARDDAAGLQVSNRLDTQLIGTKQASRNIQDGISAVQIADGAMSEITDIAFRMRQLAVQMSSNTYSQADRDGAQLEIEELIASATGIAEAANLGGDSPLLQGPDVVENNTTPLSDRDILTQLAGQMEQSEANIKAYFGIEGDGIDEMDIRIGNLGGPLARVIPNSAGDVQALEVDRAIFAAGGSGALTNERTIMHEMVHVVTVNQFDYLPSGDETWIMEGLAELIHGADERLATEIANAGSADALMGTFTGNAASSADYARAFVASRMLHDMMKEEGHSDGIRTFVQAMTAEGSTLDTVLNKFFGMDEDAFKTHVENNGASYIATNMDLTNDDTGAIGGLDADGMGIKNGEDALGNSTSYSEQPLEGFVIANWPAGFNPPHKKTFQLHTGAQAGERTEFSIRGGTAERIGLSGVNVSANARGSIEVIDKAIKNIHEIRKELGATLNGLESHLRNNTNTTVNVSDSKSRITDTDFASETATLTRNQIIQQASSSILAQANQRPNIALTLLGR